MQLEVGKKYKTRTGRIVVVEVNNTTHYDVTKYPFLAMDTNPDYVWGTAYTVDGKFFHDEDNTLHVDRDADDIVEEVVEKVIPTLNLEVGKSYKNRCGDVFKIINHNPTSRYPYNAQDQEGLVIRFMPNGSFYEDETSSDMDLVEEVVTKVEISKAYGTMKNPPLNLEVGKTYKSRNGRVVTIIPNNDTYAYNPIDYPFLGTEDKNNPYEWSSAYTADGRFHHEFKPHDEDLVEEVIGHDIDTERGVITDNEPKDDVVDLINRLEKLTGKKVNLVS